MTPQNLCEIESKFKNPLTECPDGLAKRIKWGGKNRVKNSMVAMAVRIR